MVSETVVEGCVGPQPLIKKTYKISMNTESTAILDLMSVDTPHFPNHLA